MVQDGVDVEDTLFELDNVEWEDGLRDRFGLFKVERPSSIIPKQSVAWFARFIRAGKLD